MPIEPPQSSVIPPVPSAPPPTEQEAQEWQSWWNRLTPTQKKEVEEHYTKLSSDQRGTVNKEANKVRQKFNQPIILTQPVVIHQANYYRDPFYIDPFTCYWMMRCATDLALIQIECTTTLLQTCWWAGSHLVHAAANLGGHLGHGAGNFVGSIIDHSHGSNCGNCSNCNCNGGDCEGTALAIIAVAAVGVAAGSSAFVGGIYAAKKVFNSLRNLLQGLKPLGSLWRLGGIVGGAYVGAIKGLFIGAIVGSLLGPGGTAAGAVLGAFFGAGISAGLGAIIAKYTAKFISWAAVELGVYGDPKKIISPTNVHKYRLTTKQEKVLHEEGFNTDEIWQMMKSVKVDKNKINIESSNPFDKIRKSKKADYNEFLEATKNAKLAPVKNSAGELLSYTFQAKNSFFAWSCREKRLYHSNIGRPCMPGARGG